MRNRQLAISLRVSEKEKRDIERNAKICKLTLSAYIRKLALGKVVSDFPLKDFYEAYSNVSRLKNSFKDMSEDEIERHLDVILRKMLEIYQNENGG